MVGLKPPEVPPTAAVKFFSAGTAACIADIFTFPLDTAKVRLQVQPPDPQKPAGRGTTPALASTQIWWHFGGGCGV